MAWFHKLCRQSGLALHHLMKPATEEAPAAEPRVVLRRTTVIEEVELPVGAVRPANAAEPGVPHVEAAPPPRSSPQTP